MHSRTSAIIGAIGRTLIFVGLIVLLFAGYQLWGTGLQEARSQSALESDFRDRQAALAALGATPTTNPTPPTSETPSATAPENATPTTTTPPATVPISVAPELAAELLSPRGQVMGNIKIDAIGVDKSVIEGVSRDDLRKGPGHYPTTPYPCQAGNAAIAGHRTTYGQPFHDLDLLQPGDLIEVETLQGTCYYEVEGHLAEDGTELGYFIVDPTQVEIVDDQGDNRLTLTACHPKYSARQRIVVTAIMVGAPAPALPIPADVLPEDDSPPEPSTLGADELVDGDQPGTIDAALGGATDDEINALDGALGWHFEELPAVLLWSGIGLLVMVAGWLLGRAWKKWPAYLVATPAFLLVLYFTFGHLDRMLPAI